MNASGSAPGRAVAGVVATAVPSAVVAREVGTAPTSRVPSIGPVRSSRPLVLGVLGGSGGVGASCLGAAIATRAAVRGEEVLVVDSDPAFGRIDALFDRDGVVGVRWADLAGARGALQGRALLDLLPHSADGVRILAGGGRILATGEPELPNAATMTHVLAALVAPGTAPDVVVLDLHRAAPALAEMAALCRDLVLVVGSSVGALACVAPAAQLVRALAPTTCRAWLAHRGPRSRRDVADAVAEATGLPLVAYVADEPALDERLARGCAPGSGKGPLAAAAATVLRRLDAPGERRGWEPGA